MATKVLIFREKLEAYLSGSKEEKGRILDAVCLVAGYARKAAIRKFRNIQMRDSARPEERGRAAYYTADVTAALKDVWEVGNRVCGELLHPVIPEYVTVLKRDCMWNHWEGTTEKLLEMSERTVKRRISHFERILRGHRGLAGTKPSNPKTLVPIFTSQGLTYL